MVGGHPASGGGDRQQGPGGIAMQNINLQELTPADLVELCESALREIDRRPERIAYPPSLINEFAAGVGAGLDSSGHWEGRAYIINVVLNRRSMTRDEQIAWAVSYLERRDFDDGWLPVISWWRGQDEYGHEREDLDSLAEIFLDMLRERGRQRRQERKPVDGEEV